MLFLANIKEKIKIIHSPITERQMLTFFFKDFIYLFLKRGEGEEVERKRNIDV